MTFTITMVTVDGPPIYLSFLAARVKRETVSCISHTCGIKTNQLHKDRIIWFYHSSCCVLRVKATWEGMFLVTFLQIQGNDITIKPNRRESKWAGHGDSCHLLLLPFWSLLKCFLLREAFLTALSHSAPRPHFIPFHCFLFLHSI